MPRRRQSPHPMATIWSSSMAGGDRPREDVRRRHQCRCHRLRHHRSHDSANQQRGSHRCHQPRGFGWLHRHPLSWRESGPRRHRCDPDWCAVCETAVWLPALRTFTSNGAVEHQRPVGGYSAVGPATSSRCRTSPTRQPKLFSQLASIRMDLVRHRFTRMKKLLKPVASCNAV